MTKQSGPNGREPDDERGEEIPPSPYPDCMTKVDHDRHMRNNRQQAPASDLVVVKVR